MMMMMMMMMMVVVVMKRRRGRRGRAGEYAQSKGFFFKPTAYIYIYIFFFLDDHNKSNNDGNYQTRNTLILCHNIDIQSSNPPL